MNARARDVQPIDWTDESALKALGVPPVLDVRNSDPTTRSHRGHTHRADAGAALAADTSARDEDDPETLALRSEAARDAVRQYEEAERDQAAARHIKFVEAADAAKRAAERTKERRRATARAAAAAGQGEMFEAAPAVSDEEPAPQRGEVISIRWGAWDWRTHGFWLLCHSRPGECVMTTDARRGLVPIYYYSLPAAAPAAALRPARQQPQARVRRDVDPRQGDLFGREAQQ